MDTNKAMVKGFRLGIECAIHLISHSIKLPLIAQASAGDFGRATCEEMQESILDKPGEDVGFLEETLRRVED